MHPVRLNRKQRRLLSKIVGKALWGLTLPLAAACWLLSFYTEWYDAEAVRRYLSGKRRKWRTEGFTLIELSIVLVIIGLIVGGTLVGVSLVDAANPRHGHLRRAEGNSGTVRPTGRTVQRDSRSAAWEVTQRR